LEQEIAIMGLQLQEIEQEQKQKRQEKLLLEQRREREQRQRQRQRQRQQKQQEQKQEQKQKSFYIVKRRIIGNLWEAISLFDGNNNFRGQAVFDTLQQAEDYQRKFEDKLVLRDLRDPNNKRRMITRYKNKTTLKVFKEDSLPTLKRFGLYR
jgi:hypothetical protein